LLAAGVQLVEKIDLTSARWQVLGAIALSAVPLPVAQIARNMGLSRQAVQRLVIEMERDRRVCSSDRRIAGKTPRMRFIATNGLLILAPAAFYLAFLAVRRNFWSLLEGLVRRTFRRSGQFGAHGAEFTRWHLSHGEPSRSI
jgi:hypothetical protein